MESATVRVTAAKQDTSTTTKTGSYNNDKKQILTEMFEQQQ